MCLSVCHTRASTSMKPFTSSDRHFSRDQHLTVYRYEADHVGMILMSCSGYDPSHASKTWREFDAILKRQAIVTKFLNQNNKEFAQRFNALQKPGCNTDHHSVLMSMVKDGLLHLFDNSKTYDSFVYPGYVSSFPLEPSIHPFDGVFTGRVSVG